MYGPGIKSLTFSLPLAGSTNPSTWTTRPPTSGKTQSSNTRHRRLRLNLPCLAVTNPPGDQERDPSGGERRRNNDFVFSYFRSFFVVCCFRISGGLFSVLFLLHCMRALQVTQRDWLFFVGIPFSLLFCLFLLFSSFLFFLFLHILFRLVSMMDFLSPCVYIMAPLCCLSFLLQLYSFSSSAAEGSPKNCFFVLF